MYILLYIFLLLLFCFCFVFPSKYVYLCVKKFPRAGFAVDYVGEVATGDKGDISEIGRAVLKASTGMRHPVQLEILEMGVRITDRETDKVFLP